jgi:hypothetical protein
MRTRRRVAVFAALALLISLLGFMGAPGTSADDQIHCDGHALIEAEGDKVGQNSTETLGFDEDGNRTSDPTQIVYELEVTNSGGTVTFELIEPDGAELQSVTFCVKGGNDPFQSGEVTIPPPGEVVDNTISYTWGQDISYTVVYSIDVLRPFVFEGDLEVTKTAAGTYDRTITWDIDKRVDPASHSGFVGDSFESDYEVEVTKDETSDNYRVTGTITVENDTNLPLDIDVTDVVNGTDATVDCPKDSLAVDESMVCDYEATGLTGDEVLNTAEAEGTGTIPPGYTNSGETVYASDDGTAPVSFTENTIGYDSVDVTDSVQGTLGTTNASTTFEYSDTFDCIEVGTTQYPNTARIVQTGQTADALVTVDCVQVILQGCTPGFWGLLPNGDYRPANQAAWQAITADEGWTPDTVMPGSTYTFRQALNQQAGSGALRILNFHYAAALLNAASDTIAYPYSVAELQAMYAAATTRSQQLALKDMLDAANNLGCPDRGGAV